MDIVYLLGTGTNWANNEIRFSLRSLQKHAEKFGDLFIVGEDPGFLHGFTHIAMKDAHPKNKARNIYEKIMAACKDPRVSDNFFYVHDDHFFMENFKMEKYPYYYMGTMDDYLARANTFSSYTKAIANTKQVLEASGLPQIFFQPHRPIVINKRKFIKVMAKYDWTIENGYMIKSLYCNTLGIAGEPTKDCNITRQFSLRELNKVLDGHAVFSTRDSFSQDLRDFMRKTFPDKSMWEN